MKAALIVFAVVVVARRVVELGWNAAPAVVIGLLTVVCWVCAYVARGCCDHYRDEADTITRSER